jgi:hypothetical protein
MIETGNVRTSFGSPRVLRGAAMSLRKGEVRDRLRLPAREGSGADADGGACGPDRRAGGRGRPCLT